MLDWLYKGLGAMLGWFSSITGSYALALLLYALVFKLLFLFFAIKQQKNQIAMAKLTPKIEMIKAKYKGRTDQATLRKQQEEIMALQQQEGYSMFSGCLPLLIQMPIIIFLYQVIRKPLSYIMNITDESIVNIYNLVNGVDNGAIGSIDQITLIDQIQSYHANTAGSELLLSNAGLADINAIPNFNLFGQSLAQTPSFTNFSWIVLIPFIAAGFQWLSMFISRKLTGNSGAGVPEDDAAIQAQKSMRTMDLVLPLMTVWMAFSFSAMMGVYWVFQSVLGIIQTVILAKAMPIPKFTEEELKEMRKAQKSQEKTQKAIIKTQPKYKSLHYIDEDDYDELPEVKGGASNKKPQSSGGVNNSQKPEIKD